VSERSVPIMSSDSVFRYPLDVRFFEVDSLGVVFNMWYLGWCDEAMSAYMESIGYGYAILRARGFDAVLRSAQIEWVDSLQAFQQAEIAVWVEHVGATSFRIGYQIERVEAAVAETDRVQIGHVGRRASVSETPLGRTRCAHVAVTYVCVEVEGRGKVPIPDGLRAALVEDQR